MLALAFTARCREPISLSRAVAGAAGTAAAISAADMNFSLIIQLLHLRPKANSVWLRHGNRDVVRSLKGTSDHVASTLREDGVSGRRPRRLAGDQKVIRGWSILGESRRGRHAPNVRSTELGAK
jgi:hypothetical protein